MSNSIWKSATIKISRTSGFDKSFHSLATPTVGTITPLLFDEVIPASKTKIDTAMSVNLPPLAFDTFMRVSFDLEAFFVPTRLLVQNYQYFFADEEVEYINGTKKKPLLPVVEFLNSQALDENGQALYTTAEANAIENFYNRFINPGTLADYLGFRQNKDWFSQVMKEGSSAGRWPRRHISLLPFLAYHRVWNDCYRNQKIQKPAFAPFAPNQNTNGDSRLGASPYVTFDDTSYIVECGTTATLQNARFRCADGVQLTSMRQRNWDYDPYTTAYITPNITTPSVARIDSPSPNQGITIPQLRLANRTQEFRDRNSLVGVNFVDQLNVRYGAHLSDSIAQRAICIGSASLPIYTSSVLQNSMETNQSVATNNPFASVGAKYGQAYSDAKNFLCSFESQEPGYIFVMGTLTPSACYAQGIARHFLRYMGESTIVDMANPILEAAGPERVDCSEIMLHSGLVPDTTFGYQDRYYSFKSRVDECHGLFRAGESMSAAVAQRVLTYGPISSSFLEIPTTALDNVTSVTAELSQYGCQVDAYFRYYQTLPLHDYILPTLCDPAYEHGKPVHFKRGGYEIR